MERSFGLFFFLRKRAGSTVEGKIYCRITVDGKSVELSLKRTCSIGNWNSQSGRLNGRSDSVKSINAYLDTIQQKIYEAKRSLLEQGAILTPEAIKSFVLGEDKGKSAKKILEIFQQHNDQMKVLVGKQYAPGTLQRYEISLRHTQSFIKWRYKRTDLELHFQQLSIRAGPQFLEEDQLALEQQAFQLLEQLVLTQATGSVTDLADEEERVLALVPYILQELDKPITLSVLLHFTGMNVLRLQTLCKHLYGQSVHSFVQQMRIEKSKELLLHSNESILSVAIQVGFSSPSYFSRVFKQRVGVEPRVFRKKGLRATA